MNKTRFKAYCVRTGYDQRAKNLNLSHTFVLSDEGNNWNCFGYVRDPASEGVTPIEDAEGLGYARWASLIYGDFEGRFSECPAAGLKERYDGVCHNASNRILVLAGVDVSNVPGNEFANLMYGKFGFNLEQYKNQVKASAAQLKEEAGAITDEEVDTVLQRIDNYLNDEFAILKKDCEQLLGMEFQNVSADQRDALFQVYSEYHKKRDAAFYARPDEPDFQGKYVDRLKPILIDCVKEVSAILDQERPISELEKYVAARLSK